MEQVGWILGGFAIGYIVVKLAMSLIDWAEKLEKHD
jgi:hypothetical protein